MEIGTENTFNKILFLYNYLIICLFYDFINKFLTEKQSRDN